MGRGLFETCLTTSYGPEAEQAPDGAIWVTGEGSAQEVSVFQLAEDAPREEITETLEPYLTNRTGAFPSNAWREATLLETARVVPRGGPIALLACKDTVSRSSKNE